MNPKAIELLETYFTRKREALIKELCGTEDFMIGMDWLREENRIYVARRKREQENISHRHTDSGAPT